MSGPDPHQQSAWQFAKFIAVGLLNTAFGVAVYEVLVIAGMAPQPALALAYLLGIVWNYFTHARMVFGTRGFKRLPAYVLAYFALFLTNAVLLNIALSLGVSKYAAQPVLAVIVAVPAFILISVVLTGRVPVLGWDIWPLENRSSRDNGVRS